MSWFRALGALVVAVGLHACGGTSAAPATLGNAYRDVALGAEDDPRESPERDGIVV